MPVVHVSWNGCKVFVCTGHPFLWEWRRVDDQAGMGTVRPDRVVDKIRLTRVLADAALFGFPASEVIGDPSELLGTSASQRTPGVISTRIVLMYCLSYAINYRHSDKVLRKEKMLAFLDQAINIAQVTSRGATIDVPFLGAYVP